MKRLLLATTAALVLAGSAVAQTSADEEVATTLQGYGYDAETVAKLTDEQVAQLQLAIASGDDNQVRTLLDSFELTQSDGPEFLVDTDRPDNTVTVVARVLEENGYPETTIGELTDAQVTALYTAATSQDATAVRQVIDGFDLAMAGSDQPAINSDAEARVAAELQARGYAQSEIDGLSDEDLAAIFAALNSGDETSLARAIESALAS